MDSCYLAEADGTSKQPGVPLDTSQGLLGPFGSGISGPMFGKCPREMAMSKNEDEWTTNLAHKQIAAFNRGHGWFFWNFRTEFESHWDYLEAWHRGWFPRNVSDFAALEKLDICGENAVTIGPTTTHVLAHHGIYGGDVSPPWLLANALPLGLGAVGGAVVAALIAYLVARTSKPTPMTEPTPYVAMPRA